MTIKQLLTVSKYNWLRIRIFAMGRLVATYGGWTGIDCLEGIREDLMHARVRDIYVDKNRIMQVTAIIVE